MKRVKEIKFQTMRNGRPAAYRWCWLAGRWIRIGNAEARLLIATGQAIEAGAPAPRPVTICGVCEAEWPTDSGAQVCPSCGNDGEVEGHAIRSTETGEVR